MVELMLAAGKMAMESISGTIQNMAASKVAEYEKDVATMYYNYNKNQIQEAYNDTYSSLMANYAEDRLELSNEYLDASSDINVFVSQQSTYLTTTSETESVQSRLDAEYIESMNNLTANNTYQISAITSNTMAQNLQLDQTYTNQINALDESVDAVKQNTNNRILSSVMELADAGLDEYRSYKAKNDSKLDDLLSVSIKGGLY